MRVFEFQRPSVYPTHSTRDVQTKTLPTRVPIPRVIRSSAAFAELLEHFFRHARTIIHHLDTPDFAGTSGLLLEQNTDVASRLNVLYRVLHQIAQRLFEQR
jgi:hypothetical protein